jgi:hypothetical protein
LSGSVIGRLPMPVAMQLKARVMGTIPLSRYVHRNYIFNADKKQLKIIERGFPLCIKTVNRLI